MKKILILIFVFSFFLADHFPYQIVQASPIQSTVTIRIPAIHPWVNTGIRVLSGERINITVTGTINDGSRYAQNATSGPGGLGMVGHGGHSCSSNIHNPQPNPYLVTTVPCESLVGYIGQSPPPSIPISPPAGFEVGQRASFTAAQTGALYLSVNDNYFPDNSGYFTAVIHIQKSYYYPKSFHYSPSSSRSSSGVRAYAQSSAGASSSSGSGSASYTFSKRPPGEPFSTLSASQLMANTSYPIPNVSASASSFTIAFYGNESDLRSYKPSTGKNGEPIAYQPMAASNPWIWGWRVVWSTSQSDLTDAVSNPNSPIDVYKENRWGPGSGQLNSDTWYSDIEATYSPDPPGKTINGNDPGLQGISITGAPGAAGSSVQPNTTYYFAVIRILANLPPKESMTNPLNSLGYPNFYLNYAIPVSAGGPTGGNDNAAVYSPGSVCGWTIQWGPIITGQVTTASQNESGPTGGRWGHIK